MTEGRHNKTVSLMQGDQPQGINKQHPIKFSEDFILEAQDNVLTVRLVQLKIKLF